MWNGDFVYSYQTESWFIEVMASGNGQGLCAEANMPFTETPNVGNEMQYDLTLKDVPSVEAAAMTRRSPMRMATRISLPRPMASPGRSS